LNTDHDNEGPILVTGASGLLGANFVLSALARSKWVVATSYKNRVISSEFEWFSSDLTNRHAMESVIRTIHPAWIVHCAALTNVDWCQDHPQQTKHINVDVPRYLAAAARNVGSNFVYISTDSVFNGQIGNYDEQDMPDPINVYGTSKLLGENAVTQELDKALIIRTNFYGWNAHDKSSLAEWILTRLKSGTEVPGFFDVTFAPVSATDLSNMIIDLIELKQTGVYHISSSECCNKYQFAQMTARVFGYDDQLIYPISVSEVGLKAPRPMNTALRSDKVAAVLPRPMPNIQQGLSLLKRLSETDYIHRLKALRGV